MSNERGKIFCVEMKIIYVVKAPDKTAAQAFAYKGETLDVLRAEVTLVEEANEQTTRLYQRG